MNKYILYQHAGSGNHGCEALIRTVTQTVREAESGNCEFLLISSNVEADRKYGLDKIENLSLRPLNKPFHRFCFNWFLYQLGKLTGNKKLQMKSRYYTDWLDENAVYIAVGGDNYCYGKGAAFNDVDNEIKGKKILWGCSVEPSDLDEDLCKRLKGFSYITARESITYNALTEKGFKNVSLVADTAFMLPAERPALNNDKYVGINISPMIMKYAADSKAVFDNYKNLIESILNQTDYKIMFVPHVYESGNNDADTIKSLLQDIDIDDERLVLLPDMNCMQLKGYISRCDFFIGARTHSTIAAYSTGVPTIVVGYSVKARGIATDIFGSFENYVIPVEKMESGSELPDAYNLLSSQADDMKAKQSAYTENAVNKIRSEYSLVLKKVSEEK